jgi:3-oxoacyl-[acyl-carrier protein] reductase
MPSTSTSRTSTLAGKVAIVTGASAGIGEAVAKSFAAAGAKVVISGRDEKRLRAVKAAIEAAGGSAAVYVGDIRGEAANAALVQLAMSEYGALHIAVNNAGVYSFGPLSETSSQQVDDMVDVNIKGVVYALKHQLPAIAAHSSSADWGSVINLSTGGTKQTSAMAAMGAIVYSATKAAVDQLTVLGAAAGAPLHVRVNAVAPGPVLTPGVASLGMKDLAAADAFAVQETLMSRSGSVEEIADAIMFLVASPAAAIMTGVVLPVDGGMRVK